MDKLLDDLLADSRIGRFHYNGEKVDLKQLLEDIIALANVLASFCVLLAEGLPPSALSVFPWRWYCVI